MADSLLTALQGLRYDPLQTAAGIGVQSAAKIAPALIQPGQGFGTQLGISLGSMLASSLLGRAAVNAANEETIANQRLALEITPLSLEDRLSRIEQVEDPLSRRSLIDYSNQLRSQEIELGAQIQNKLKEIEAFAGARQKAEAEFYETPLGKATFEAELTRAEKLAAAQRLASDPLNQMKREAEFYGTPEGQKIWEDYIKRQEQLGQTKRLSFEDFAAREVEKTNQKIRRDERLRDLNVEERKDILKLNKDSQLEFLEKLNNAKVTALKEGKDYSTERAKIISEIKQEANKKQMELDVEKRMRFSQLDNNAKVELEKRLNELNLTNLKEGQDYETESKRILKEVDKEANLEEVLLRSDLSIKRMIKSSELQKDVEVYKKYLEREYPTVSAKIKDDFSKAYGVGIVGLDLAEDIEKEASRLNVLTARNAFASTFGGTADINARLQDFINQYRLVVTGQAAAEAELARIESVIKGSPIASPQEVATRIREIVRSARTKTTESFAASTTSYDELINRVRNNPLDTGGFNVKLPEVGGQLKSSLTPTPSPTGTPITPEMLLQRLEDVRQRRDALKKDLGK